MKDFLKYLAATILGMAIVSVFSLLLFFIMLGSMVSINTQKPALQDNSVLRINLSGTINERAQENPLAQILGNDVLQQQGLDDILRAIEVAKTDDRISGIYLEGGVLSADFASMQEIRGALNDFKKSQKFLIAYGENYTQGAYYICSVADKVLLNPSGMLDWHGIASQPIFYKDLLDKIGVKMQVFRVGTYKSYVEPYTRTDMSPENKQQVQAFIDDIWDKLCQDVSDSRQLQKDSVKALVDKYITLADPQIYVKEKLVDELCYVDQVRDKLRNAADGNIHTISPRELAMFYEPNTAKEKVAVYYCEGSIVGAETSGFSNEAQIVGPTVVSDLDRLMNDKDIKAVVLRVNSGGGSAYASEQIWHAVQLLKQKKPVVVSMSGMAASGGYYISCGANKIIAEPTTLTGSIGIFGMVPDATGLMTEKLGLHFDVVKTNEASDFGAMGRPMNGQESQAMQSYVDRGYQLFLKRVAEGRHMQTAEVDSIAQGRVWTGSMAKGIGLVDQLGNLQTAIAEAAKLAQLTNYATVYAPLPQPWFSTMIQQNGTGYFDRKLRSTLGVYYEPLRFVTTLEGRDCLQARIAYEPNLR